MKTASSPLVAFLNGNSRGYIAELYTLTLQSGTVYRWTTWDGPLSYGGQTYSQAGKSSVPLFTRGGIRETAGIEVASLELTLECGTGAMVGGVKLQTAAVNGVLDGATVQVQRAYMQTAGTIIDTLIRFSGAVSQVHPTSTTVKLIIAADTERMNVKIPFNTIQPACNHALFDAGCGLLASSFRGTGAAGAGTTATVVTWPGNVQAAGYYSAGWMQFTSGALNGTRAVVQQHAGTTIVVAVQLPGVPAAGDTFDIYPGCDRSRWTCTSKFSNASRFRGFPWALPNGGQ